VETVRAVAAVSEGTKHEAVASVRRQCQEEVASLQAILKGEGMQMLTSSTVLRAHNNHPLT
uniref:Rabaptin coiled-coil domain-containing protein n=1 Tax=Varanus komodoensis TaxID=61221 RepID=A0A8D2IK48_VARKO